MFDFFEAATTERINEDTRNIDLCSTEEMVAMINRQDALVAGAVAAAFYGIPRDIRDQAMAYLDGEVYTIYDRFSRQY